MSADCGLRGLDLLDAAIAHIQAHPETWDQSRWRCGTGMCLSGWMCDLAGGRWLTGPDEAGSAYLVPEPADRPEDIITTVLGDGVVAGARAERLLGFASVMYEALGDMDDERGLFAAGNTLDDLKAMRDDLRAAQAAGVLAS